MVANQNKNYSSLLGIFIIVVIVFLNALGPFFSKQSIVTMGLLPALTVIAFMHDVKSITVGKREFLLLLFIFLMSFTTVFYYKGYDEFMRSLNIFFGAVLSAYLVLGLTKDRDYTPFFHIGYVLSILFLFGIMYYQGNIDLANFASAVDYRDRFMLNANAYSYFCIFGNFSLFYLYLKQKTKFLTLLLLVLPILFMVIAFVTQSRAGLVLIIFINLCFWGVVNKNELKSKFKRLVRSLFIVVILFALAIKFLDVYQNSRIKNRMVQTTTREDSREVLVREGLLLFAEHPLLGVGLGQFPFYNSYHLFSHNSYVEILAEQGIFVGILLFIMYLRPTLQSIRNLRGDPKNEVLRCHLLFFLTFLLYNNAYVFYKFPFSMMYFFLIVSMQNKVTFAKNGNA